jgi:type I restriction enzyme S subunit
MRGMMVKQQERRLPEGWRWVKLGDVCEVVMGQSPPGTSYNSNGLGEPLLNGPTEFGLVHPNPVQWTTEPTRFAEKNDILFCVRASIGRKNIADRRYCIGRGLAAIRGKNNSTETNFLYILLDHVTHKLLAETAGSTFPNLPGVKLNNFLIPLPPIAEQKRLVAILNDRFAAIETARKATEAQLEAAKALPVAYLREVFNSPEAQGWEKKRLGDISTISTGTTPSTKRPDYYQGDMPFIKTAEVVNNRITSSSIYVSQQAIEDYGLKIYPVGTILMAMYGQGKTRGQVSILDIPATTTQNAAAIVPTEEVLSEYIWYWLRGRYEHLRQLGFQGDLSHLSLGVVKDLEIPFPSLDIQKYLVLELDDKFFTSKKLQHSLQAQLEAINALPPALLRQAFNGEL